MHILGISCFYHDAAAAILRDGQLIAAAEEERFSRKKHDFGFPQHAIEFCMNHAGIKTHDLDYVVFYEKPFRKFDRILRTVLQTFPRSAKVFREAMIGWLLDKMWVSSLIEEKLGVPRERILFTEHHQAHAASAYFCSPYDEAAFVTIDGVGEWATTTIGTAKGNDLRILKEIHFPHSIGLLYSAFTAFLGFKVNEGEYKVMGMAPYGEPKYVDKVWKVVRPCADGSFWLDMDYFDFHHSSERAYSWRFETLFGEPRPPGMKFFTESTHYPSYFGAKPSNFNELARKNRHYADIAASIQKVTEDLILSLAEEAHRLTGAKHLCMAGGVALNSVANGRVLRETPFESCYIQPAAGDGGGAVGAALYAWHVLLANPKQFVMEHAYWGKDYGLAAIDGFLKSENIQHETIDNDDVLLDRVVDMLQEGKVIGWYQGRFEWGPRALGNRSILADARRAEMKDIVNTKIKFREPFRPFAPSVLAEHASKFFDLPEAERHYPARFMLYVTDVIEDKRDIVPAITHVNGTGRLQTVFSETNPRYYQVIDRFRQATGVPLVLNTSFNLKGEPIVASPQNAYWTYSHSGMDALVLENRLITKE